MWGLSPRYTLLERPGGGRGGFGSSQKPSINPRKVKDKSLSKSHLKQAGTENTIREVTECFLCLSRRLGRRQVFPNLKENQPGNVSQLTAPDHNFKAVIGKWIQGMLKTSLQSCWNWKHVTHHFNSWNSRLGMEIGLHRQGEAIYKIFWEFTNYCKEVNFSFYGGVHPLSCKK